MIAFIVVFTLLTLLVATEAEPGQSASLPAPAGPRRRAHGGRRRDSGALARAMTGIRFIN
jgi:hypothetical protein